MQYSGSKQKVKDDDLVNRLWRRNGFTETGLVEKKEIFLSLFNFLFLMLNIKLLGTLCPHFHTV